MKTSLRAFILTIPLSSVLMGIVGCSSPDKNLSRLLETKACPSCNLKGVDLAGADLSAVDLSSAKLNQANLSNANLTGSDLSFANLTGANLDGADFSQAKLTGVTLADANVLNVTFAEVEFIGAGLADLNLSNVDLSGADLSSGFLQNTNLSRANLQGTNFAQAYLQGSDLSGANLAGANLTGVSGEYTTDETTILPDGQTANRNGQSAVSESQTTANSAQNVSKELSNLRFLAVCEEKSVPEATAYSPEGLNSTNAALITFFSPDLGTPLDYDRDTKYFRNWSTRNLEQVSVVACIQENSKAELLESCEYTKPPAPEVVAVIKRYRSELAVTLRAAKTGEIIDQILFFREAAPCNDFTSVDAAKYNSEVYIKRLEDEFADELNAWIQPRLGAPIN